MQHEISFNKYENFYKLFIKKTPGYIIVKNISYLT